MNEFASLVGIGAALAIGAASPGPSFVMIARTAAASGRANGMTAALGMGIGALLFAMASLLGLNTVFLAVPILYVALKVVGGVYLAYLGLRIWRGAKHGINTSSTANNDGSSIDRNHLLLGLTTQVSNPKTAIVYASVFATFLPPSPSIQYNIVVAALVFLIEAGWYTIVATMLSSEAPRGAYLRYKKWIDRTAGGALGALGIKLAISATHQ